MSISRWMDKKAVVHIHNGVLLSRKKRIHLNQFWWDGWNWSQLYRVKEARKNWCFLRVVVIVQSLSHVWLFATPWTAAHQASLSITNSWRLLKLTSIEWVMPSNHLILCRPLLLLPLIFPSIRVFSNESALHIRGPKYWSFNICPSSEHSGLISF